MMVKDVCLFDGHVFAVYLIGEFSVNIRIINIISIFKQL